MGIESFFPVQEAAWVETIGPGAFERDVCINSPTGSGKTLAYALPIVQTLSTRKVRCLRALVVLPTRDLALQVHSPITFSKFIPPNPQCSHLSQTSIHFISGHLTNGNVSCC
jgi:superfamily II DNA/RNA helicase